jgi:hypothetical protein
LKSKITTTILKSRSLMGLIFIAYFATYVAVAGWSKTAGYVLLVVGFVGLGALFLKFRPKSGIYAISTRCEKCESSLQGFAGLPRSTCQQCGQRQSWAKGRG